MHTPGPWTVEEGYSGSGPWDRLTVGDGHVVVCTVNRDIPAGQDNARLLAAAPELLAALQKIASLEATGGEAANLAQAVIAKAAPATGPEREG